jgi:hypothetical protein
MQSVIQRMLWKEASKKILSASVKTSDPGSESRHWVLVTGTVLPGPEAASSLIEQKTTAICRKYTAISNLSKIPLLFCYFWVFCALTFNFRKQFFPNCIRFYSPNICHIKFLFFRYFWLKRKRCRYQNFAAFRRKIPLYLTKIAVNTAIWQHCTGITLPGTDLDPVLRIRVVLFRIPDPNILPSWIRIRTFVHSDST